MPGSRRSRARSCPLAPRARALLGRILARPEVGEALLAQAVVGSKGAAGPAAPVEAAGPVIQRLVGVRPPGERNRGQADRSRRCRLAPGCASTRRLVGRWAGPTVHHVARTGRT